MSIKSFCVIALAAIIAGSLAACSQSGQPEASNTSATPATQPAASVANVDGATLTVKPAATDDCKPNQPFVADVSWHSSAPKVKVMVSTSSDPTPHLFSESGFTGSARTGDWVVSGTTFTMVEAKTGTVLAKTVVAQHDCKR